MKNSFLILIVCLFITSCATINQIGPPIKWGGRATVLALKPDNGNIIIAGSESGGLFKTTNRGRFWKHIDVFNGLYINDIKFSPTHPNVVIVSISPDFTATNNGGIWRSIDAGDSWSRPFSAIPPASSRCTDRPGAYNIAFGQEPNRVYIGTDCGLAISDDDGINWRHINPDPTPSSINFDRNQDKIVSVITPQTGKIYCAHNNSFYYSLDGGGSWSESMIGSENGTTDGMFSLAASPFNSEHLLATLTGIYVPATETVREHFVSALFKSTDHGVHWNEERKGEYWRPPFVKIGPSLSGETNKGEVYFSDGHYLYRRTYLNTPSDFQASATEDWTGISAQHSDPADLLFDNQAPEPIAYACDGGIFMKDAGALSFNQSVNGFAKFEAVQIYDIIGQHVAGDDKTDLYMGTQDNSIWCFINKVTWGNEQGGDEFFVQTTREAATTANSLILYEAPGNGDNFSATRQLSTVTPWVNPPSYDQVTHSVIDNGPFSRNPCLLSEGKYLQITQHSEDPTDNVLYLKEGAGDWIPKISLPYLIAQGVPYVTGPPENPVLYLAVRSAWSLFIDGIDYARFHIIRIDNVLTSPSVREITSVALGLFAHNFVWMPVYGVDKLHPDHLIVPDMSLQKLRISTDGGLNWHEDEIATNFITRGGEILFYANPYKTPGSPIISQVSSIAVDPDNSNHILIGTAKSGIIRTGNNGTTWSTIEGSQNATDACSFFFDFNNEIEVGTWGRGLWSINKNKLSRPNAAANFQMIVPDDTTHITGQHGHIDGNGGADKKDSIQLLISSRRGLQNPAIVTMGEIIEIFAKGFKGNPDYVNFLIDDKVFRSNLKVNEEGFLIETLSSISTFGYHTIKIEAYKNQKLIATAYNSLYVAIGGKDGQ
ncbi:MAG: hypothetical protein ABI594_10810 [Ginsengibacter sp.]